MFVKGEEYSCRGCKQPGNRITGPRNNARNRVTKLEEASKAMVLSPRKARLRTRERDSQLEKQRIRKPGLLFKEGAEGIKTIVGVVLTLDYSPRLVQHGPTLQRGYHEIRKYLIE